MTITPATRRAISNRSMGRCEWCGRSGVALQLHHRLYRSRGGTDGPENLVALCGSGNHTGCHGRAHGAAAGDLDAAYVGGISIRRGGEPAEVPIASVVYGIPMWLLPTGDVVFDAPPRVDPAAAPMMTPTRTSAPGDQVRGHSTPYHQAGATDMLRDDTDRRAE